MSETLTLIATLIAAIIAAAASITAVILQMRAAKTSEMRVAQRVTIRPYLPRLATALHQVVASSVVYIKRYREGHSVENWQERGKKAQKDITDIRWKVRYSLWGLDEGLRTMSRLFDWITHLRDYPDKTELLLQEGDTLRRALDFAIRNSH